MTSALTRGRAMAVRKIESEVEYKASDGRSFDSQAEAERHEKLISVRGTYERARKIYARTVAETFRTVDSRLPSSNSSSVTDL